jgi:hypothetical protein
LSGWLSGDYAPKDDDQIAKVMEVLRAEQATVDLDMLVECPTDHFIARSAPLGPTTPLPEGLLARRRTRPPSPPFAAG